MATESSTAIAREQIDVFDFKDIERIEMTVYQLAWRIALRYKHLRLSTNYISPKYSCKYHEINLKC